MPAEQLIRQVEEHSGWAAFVVVLEHSEGRLLAASDLAPNQVAGLPPHPQVQARILIGAGQNMSRLLLRASAQIRALDA